MEKKYLKYQITNTDNLNIISEKLGISITELVGFHNVHCKNNDSIGSGLPKHLTEIFVYPHIREIKKEKYPTASFEEGYVLKCKPNFKKQNFGVQYKIENNNGTTNMSFEVSLQCKQEKSGHFLYEFIKKEVYINYEETDLMADQLAEKTAHVLYPLQIIINPNGQLISIHNFATIKKRWIDTKNELKEYYVGEWSDKYLELTEKTLENEDTLFNAISNDWFLKSYFNGLYVNYTPSFKIKTTVNFPIVFNIKPIKYAIIQSTDEYLDNYKQLIIEQNGVANDNRSANDVANGLSFGFDALENPEIKRIKGTFEAKYFLNPENNTIESLSLQCSINAGETKTVNVVVSLLDKN